MLRMWRRIRKETDKMGYKKDMSKYEDLEGWRDVALENSLIGGRKNMEKELRSRTVKTRSVIWN